MASLGAIDTHLVDKRSIRVELEKLEEADTHAMHEDGVRCHDKYIIRALSSPRRVLLVVLPSVVQRLARPVVGQVWRHRDNSAAPSDVVVAPSH